MNILTKNQKISNVIQRLERDGFSNNEISFMAIGKLTESILDSLLDSSCDEYQQFVNEITVELHFSYSQNTESMQ